MAIIVGQGPNVNVSKLNDNQQEMTVAMDPTNPGGVFIASKTYHGTLVGKYDSFVNIAPPLLFKDHSPGLFVAYGNNTGGGWTGRIAFTGGPTEASIGERSLPAAYTDPQAAFDGYGNLYLTYMSFVHQFGKATGGAASALVDTARQWLVPTMWTSRLLVLRPDGGRKPQEIKAITTVTPPNTLNIAGAWTDPPANGDAYAIMSGVAGPPPDYKFAIYVLSSTNGGRASSSYALWTAAPSIIRRSPPVRVGI